MSSMNRNFDFSAQRRRIRSLLRGAAATLAAAFVLAGCEGDNLFEGGSVSQGPPRVTSIDVPGTVTEGNTITVRASVQASRGLTSVQLDASGATDASVSQEVDGAPTEPTVVEIPLTLPAVVVDTTLTIRIVAVDRTGRVSETQTRTVAVRRRGGPVVTRIEVPAQVAEGARIDIRLRAFAPRGLSELVVRYRGAVNDEETFEVSPARSDTVVIDATLQLPALVTDSVLTIEAFGRDQAGGVSDINRITVQILDRSAPTVSGGATGDVASPGGDLQIRVVASDPFGITQIGYALITEAGDTIGTQPFLVATSGVQKDTTFSLVLPGTLQPGALKVMPIAINRANLRGVAGPLALTLADTLGPIVNTLEPQDGESYTRGTPLRVRVHVADSSSGIASLTLEGVAFRFFPDTLQNSTPVVRYPLINVPFPQGPDRPAAIDTIIVRDLQPNADTTSEPLYIIATATDFTGNVTVDTTRLVPGPRITLLNPQNNSFARPNSQMQIRVQAFDPAAGLDSLKVFVTGAVTQTFERRGLGGTQEQISIPLELNIPAVTGDIEIRAAVWNSQGVQGSTPQAVRVTIQNASATDQVPPKVLRVVESRQRLELNDSIRIQVRATDDNGSGIIRIGAVVVVQPANPTLPQRTLFFEKTFPVVQTGTPDTTFVLQLRGAYTETGSITFTQPQTFAVQVHAWAVDAEGNCGASVRDEYQSLQCVPSGSGFVASGQSAPSVNLQFVPGTSVPLPFGSLIADILPDTTPSRPRIYMSNLARNQVEVIELADTALSRNPVLVGSEPWGLFLVPGGGAPDTLMVANSGGTNISFVPTDELREDGPRRLLTPNDVLWEIVESTANGFLRYSVRKLEFSDRPQFIGQDRNKVILYSTKPAPASNTEGTLRRAIADPTPGNPADDVRPEVSILFGREAIGPGTDSWAVARIDSIFVLPGADNGNDLVRVYDHAPGVPSAVFFADGYPFDALALLADAGSDVVFDRGSWIRGAVGFSDTTYIAWSKDLSTLGFGEGNTAGVGRIILWTAAGDPLTPELGAVTTQGTTDLINNASEEVNGLALNADGSFGAARGSNSAYFFSNDLRQEGPLRLQGVFSPGVTGGTGGIALHPHHGSGDAVSSSFQSLAFVPTATRSIKVVDTFHFFERGDIPIRDNIVGQLRSFPALPGENSAFGGDSERCDFVVAHLVGATSGNAAVIITVRRKDLWRNAPACKP